MDQNLMQHFPHPNEAPDEIRFQSASYSIWDFKMFESVKGRMHQQMPAQVPSYKLTLWAKN